MKTYSMPCACILSVKAKDREDALKKLRAKLNKETKVLIYSITLDDEALITEEE
jgi:ketopantoate reductase